MIQKTVEYIKNHYQFLILLSFLAYFLNPLKFIQIKQSNLNTRTLVNSTSESGEFVGLKNNFVQDTAPSTGGIERYAESSNTTSTLDKRKTEKNYTLNLAVKDTEKTIEAFKVKVESLGGFVVNSNYYNVGELQNGNIQVRVPSEKADEFEAIIIKNSLKIISKQTNGQDLTDQYTDLESRLNILIQNKIRFEEIMKSAQKIEDILNIQNQIFNLQNQIDNIKGQQKYIENLSSTTKYNINLSTDEYSFSYIPKDSWDLKGTYKLAVRSLVLTTRNIVNNAIWVGVYAFLWLPLVLISIFIYKKYWRSKRK